MSADEIRRRFRLMLVAYCVLVASAVAGLWINYEQQRQIRREAQQLCHNAQAIGQALHHAPTLVIDCSRVFK